MEIVFVMLKNFFILMEKEDANAVLILFKVGILVFVMQDFILMKKNKTVFLMFVRIHILFFIMDNVFVTLIKDLFNHQIQIFFNVNASQIVN